MLGPYKLKFLQTQPNIVYEESLSVGLDIFFGFLGQISVSWRDMLLLLLYADLLFSLTFVFIFIFCFSFLPYMSPFFFYLADMHVSMVMA